MPKKETINVKGTEITVITTKESDYISLTDMANAKAGQARAADVIKNWIRTRTTLEFLGTWEQLYNPDFKVVEFDHFKMQAGLPSFVLSAGEWITKTKSIGIYVKQGKYGGTYAHKDIAFEFGAAISAVFRLFLIKEFQRLKEEELRQKSLEWNLQRTLSKINYRIHTDAIKEHIIPNIVTKEQISYTYAEEADLLNVALFGMTAKQWRDTNPDLKGNVRDYATLEQLVVLSNMESINALLIRQELSQSDRLVQLNNVAITQMKSLVENKNLKMLK
ncbi:MAG: KilA-N domain-containing protein [Desulfuromonadales bacterium]|nr:KilA-N domain-containing protein [Desulfuromonadales bacterium]